MRIVALLPMRHESERIPGKNHRPFAGRPLYQHILTTLAAVPEITQIVVDTDSPLIMQQVADVFPAVRVVERPPHLRGGMVAMNDVLLHDVTQVAADLYLQTHSTNPLLRPETIRCAVTAFTGTQPRYDSLLAVTRLQTRLWTAAGGALNHNPDVLLRTQDLPPVFEENSNLYLFTRATLEQRKNRIGARPLLFEIDRLEAWDIDEETDFRVAEFLFQQRRGNG